MRSISAFFLAACLVVALSDRSDAHVGAGTVPIFELSSADLPDLKDGSVIGAPPVVNLTAYAVQVDGDDIFVGPAL